MSEGNRRPLYRYRFNDVVVDEARFELSVGGAPVEVQPKTLRAFFMLLQAAGEVVPVERFNEQLWPRTQSPANYLNVQLKKLRDALGPENAKRIVTVDRVGFRFDGMLERVAVGRQFEGTLALEADLPVPLRANFVLEELLARSVHGEVWRAHHSKIDERRVYKFSADGPGLDALKREVTLYRVLRETLGERDDFIRIIDWNFETSPFFIELEDAGQNLAQWVEDGALVSMPLASRLDLFLRIADAVSNAHRVAVLHKDLKPSNILIAPAGPDWIVKVGDFGSGRLLDAERLKELDISRHSLTLTQGVMTDHRFGTFGYLAPEVVRGEPSTVQSDLYALGLILYQIAVGDLNRPLAPGWERDVADDLLKQDIAAATDGDPQRRLNSVAELADRVRGLPHRHEDADKQRAAADAVRAAEEVARASADALERARVRRRFMTRLAASLTIGMLGTLGFALQSFYAKQALAQQVKLVQTLNHFISSDIIGAANPTRTGNVNISVRDIVKKAGPSIDTKFQNDPPEVRATLHASMQGMLYGLSDTQASIDEGKLALAALGSDAHPDARLLARVLLTQAQTLAAAGKTAESQQTIERLRDVIVKAGFQNTDVQAALWRVEGSILNGALDPKEARAKLEKAWTLIKEVPDASWDDEETIEWDLAQSDMLAAKFDSAEALARDLIARQVRRYGKLDGRTCYSGVLLAYILNLSDKMDGARTVLQPAADCLAQTLGPDNEATVNARMISGDIAFKMKSYAEAEVAYKVVLQSYDRIHTRKAVNTIILRGQLAQTLHLMGRTDEAVTLLREAWSDSKGVADETSPTVEIIKYRLADCLLDLHQPQQAAPLLDGLKPETLKLAQIEEDWEGRLAYQAGRLAMQQRKPIEAVTLFEKALAIISEKNPDSLTPPPMLERLIDEAKAAVKPSPRAASFK